MYSSVINSGCGHRMDAGEGEIVKDVASIGRALNGSVREITTEVLIHVGYDRIPKGRRPMRWEGR